MGLVVVSNQFGLQHVVGELAGWKLAVVLIAIGTLAAILLVLFKRGLEAFGKIAAAFWTMALTCFGIAAFVLMAGVFSAAFSGWSRPFRIISGRSSSPAHRRTDENRR